MVECDPDCEVRTICRAAHICCARDDLLKERILTRARTLTYLLKDFALGAILAAGLADVYVFDRFKHYIERSDAERMRSTSNESEPRAAGDRKR